jgi:hypothetical protein
MAAFPFFQRASLAEHARDIQLAAFSPSLEFDGLLTGIDNIRHDVYLSPAFTDAARQHIHKLIVRDGNVESLLAPKPASFSAPPQIIRKQEEAKPSAETGEFKPLLAELLVEGLNRAKAEDKPALDRLLRVGVVKFLRAEVTAQFHSVLEQLRGKLAEFEGPRQAHAGKGIELRERCAVFQLAKKTLLRKAGLELFQTFREIEKETLARMRRALFGGGEEAAYAVLLNRLMFTEDGRDDYINAAHYVMLGNFDRDPDRMQAIEEIARSFLDAIEMLAPDGNQFELDPLLNVPENAQELVAGGSPDESTPKGKSQKALLQAWTESLERAGVLEHVIAAYEAAPLLAEYAPPINAQQLKMALISRTERGRVERLLQEHGRVSPANFDAAVKRAGSYRSAERLKVAGRFLLDFMRYHRDLRSLDALKEAAERVNVISNDRLRELSAINRTLYEFLLPREQKPSEDKVSHHVILKADIRDSTSLTRTLFERGLNPASYFSLNFYDPVNTLLTKYQASKVFIEGDAVILALFGREGKREFAVARACALAREMISIVRAYNEKSQKANLPTLELGIGISFQDSPPMYLMDGDTRIMISKALNESDRLSSCNKGARHWLHGTANLFNVYTFKTVEDEETGGNPDEFLMRYNVGGVHISEAAFAQLQSEISLDLHEMHLPTPWGEQKVRLYSGLAPLGGDIFRPLIVREAPIAHIDATNFSFKKWTGRRYYEVCTNEAVYFFPELQAASRAGAHD